MCYMQNRFKALISACVMSLIATTGWSQTLTWLGTLGGDESEARSVSADGKVVVGEARNAAGQWCAFRWTASRGMRELGTLPGGTRSVPRAVSADGKVVVGWSFRANGWRAFRWTAAGGMQDLGTLGGQNSEANSVSADGSVVVGYAENAAGQARAFRWTASGGMRDLGTLPSGGNSMAYGVSADGSVVVGSAYNAVGLRAFRWTAAGGMQNLGTLGGSHSQADSVSADGKVVVGEANNAAGQRLAFRWTASKGMQYLGTLGGVSSIARSANADGSIVVGCAFDGAFRLCAFRWTATGGMKDLNQIYLLPSGSRLEDAFAISPDGRYIVGRGYNATTGRREAFLLDTRPSRTRYKRTYHVSPSSLHTVLITEYMCTLSNTHLINAIHQNKATSNDAPTAMQNCAPTISDAPTLQPPPSIVEHGSTLYKTPSMTTPNDLFYHTILYHNLYRWIPIQYLRQHNKCLLRVWFIRRRGSYPKHIFCGFTMGCRLRFFILLSASHLRVHLSGRYTLTFTARCLGASLPVHPRPAYQHIMSLVIFPPHLDAPPFRWRIYRSSFFRRVCALR